MEPEDKDTRGCGPRRRRLAPVLALLLIAGALFSAGSLLGCGGEATTTGRYLCPMHPGFVADRPGDCAICGMRLVPAESQEADAAPPGEASEERAAVVLAPEIVALAGIQTQPATMGRLTRTLRAAGTVLADPARVRHIATRVGGWIEKLEVKATGERVRKGQPLFTLYAPDLVPIQEDYLRILRLREIGRRQAPVPESKRPTDDIEASARQRIARYDLPDEFIADLARDGVTKTSIPYSAPASGYVQIDPIFEGQQVDPGMHLMAITDLSEVWVEANLFEGDIARVSVGQEAAITLPYDPRVRLTGRIVQVNPFLDPDNRTLTVRIRCPNGDQALKPGMFATVELTVGSGEGVIVPAAAVLDTGLRQVVFVASGEGRFEPREVRVGLRSAGQAEILSGIAVGESVAVQGNFLLDAESRLKATRAGADGAGGPR